MGSEIHPRDREPTWMRLGRATQLERVLAVLVRRMNACRRKLRSPSLRARQPAIDESEQPQAHRFRAALAALFWSRVTPRVFVTRLSFASLALGVYILAVFMLFHDGWWQTRLTAASPAVLGILATYVGHALQRQLAADRALRDWTARVGTAPSECFELGATVARLCDERGPSWIPGEILPHVERATGLMHSLWAQVPGAFLDCPRTVSAAFIALAGRVNVLRDTLLQLSGRLDAPRSAFIDAQPVPDSERADLRRRADRVSQCVAELNRRLTDAART